jgi:hypothetical protein
MFVPRKENLFSFFEQTCASEITNPRFQGYCLEIRRKERPMFPQGLFRYMAELDNQIIFLLARHTHV